MTSTGQVYPSSGTSASVAPHSANAWSNAPVITTDNATSATDTTNAASITAASFDLDDQSQLLLAQGFDFSGIPDGSTIDGVTCRVNAWYVAGQGSGSIDLLQLLDTNSAVAGTNQCATPVALTTTDSTVITKGSTSDTWGNALTTTWVKNSNFGVGLGIIATALNADVFVDYISLEIEYTAPSAIPKSLADASAATDELTVTAIQISLADAGAGTDRITVDSGSTGAPAFVKQTAGNAAAASNATANVTSTTGNLLVALVARIGGTATGALTGVIDSASNTWLPTAVTRGAVSGAQHTRIECWACPNATAVTSVTFQSGTSQYYAWNIVEFSNAATSEPTDVASPDYSSAASSTTITTPSISTTNANDIVIAAIHYPLATGALDSGLANALDDFDDAGNTGSGRAAYEIVAATGSYSATWTLGSARTAGTLTVAFKGGAAAPPTSKTLSDAGAGTDSLPISVATTVADSGAGTQTIAPAATLPATDSGASSQTLSTTAGIPFTDLASANDTDITLNISVSVSVTDSGAGYDMP